ncbi:hypothetical protein BTHERMOSOX_208 [Bathymodiolus thermophilus thioautotrophic gill symbiont]|uniref:Uncharacterized protein n=1 Tax=Bathymodiolus thermophilus thioautotrophic gill symbiont TaxID=2360 RepID=A0A1J5UGH2_9GAMM|nr:hypothetical protein [Bathymodiolus thermophilus thioautotrophic gill symbiont]AYQ57631.1 hypothetical protein MS2017_1971 [Bathymodiolus thermophilus thioautotrophic gill symbiont]OIR25021.1 hypothetical protein BGC33_12415 [Bathymodiolus thermophilus thioautotrophic gill symbiont]SHA11578.1 hypothetical protein BTHERMOSOX_208 [Bathymodiolus thermophilus thioautotrophic gill symbiont]
MKMIFPTAESIEFAQKSAKKIATVKIIADTFMNFDADYQNFNKVDRGFMQNLIEEKDLSREYTKKYIYG